ncbi:hypothetical protein SAMN04488057_106151 [Cyclobacterium lianum]|uniref:Uncharacterized protein n=1 Tax=Cyclobacterium lianum TaxID=388280 RepID=A0A1M7NYC2_9BACT|nr:hypothetical protein SAMN04488057_106151 [Cyclobacterium lianum]
MPVPYHIQKLLILIQSKTANYRHKDMVFDGINYSTILAKWYGILAINRYYLERTAALVLFLT